jgi:hypothetical protein
MNRSTQSPLLCSSFPNQVLPVREWRLTTTHINGGSCTNGACARTSGEPTWRGGPVAFAAAASNRRSPLVHGLSPASKLSARHHSELTTCSHAARRRSCNITWIIWILCAERPRANSIKDNLKWILFRLFFLPKVPNVVFRGHSRIRRSCPPDCPRRHLTRDLAAQLALSLSLITPNKLIDSF